MIAATPEYIVVHISARIWLSVCGYWLAHTRQWHPHLHTYTDRLQTNNTCDTITQRLFTHKTLITYRLTIVTHLSIDYSHTRTHTQMHVRSHRCNKQASKQTKVDRQTDKRLLYTNVHSGASVSSMLLTYLCLWCKVSVTVLFPCQYCFRLSFIQFTS